MSQPIDLFCYTTLFAKFNMLTSFSPEILREHKSPHDFQWTKDVLSPHKVLRDLFLNTFHGRWGIKFFGVNFAYVNFLRGCYTWEINDSIMYRAGEFYKCIFKCKSSNLKTLNLNTFASQEGIYIRR